MRARHLFWPAIAGVAVTSLWLFQSAAEDRSTVGLVQRVEQLEERLATLERVLFGDPPQSSRSDAPPSPAAKPRVTQAVEPPVNIPPSELLPNLPDEFDVYAVGTYKGTQELDIQLGDNGHTVCQTEVIAHSPTRPVVLVLTAYDPSVWRVGRTEGTTIAGILVSGYHPQALIGVEKSIPVAISSYEEPGPFAYFYAYKAGAELLRMNTAVQKLTGRPIKRLYNRPTHRDVYHVGRHVNEPLEAIYSDERAIDDYVVKGRFPAGQRGVDRLVEERALRLATQEDIDAWVTKASAEYQKFNKELRVNHYMRLGHTYVVVKQTHLPNGMYGAHSRAFIIPEGVPLPSGPKCHNTFYLMDGSAQGPGARAD